MIIIRRFDKIGLMFYAADSENKSSQKKCWGGCHTMHRVLLQGKINTHTQKSTIEVEMWRESKIKKLH